MNSFRERFWNSFYIIPLCFSAALAIAVIYLVRETPVFEAVATIQTPSPNEPDIRAMMTSSLIEEVTHHLNRPNDEVVQKLNQMAVWPERRSSLIRLQIKASDPLFAADYANTWATIIVSNATASFKDAYSLVEAAKPMSKPVSPKKGVVLIQAAVIGIFVGISLTVIVAFIQASKAQRLQKVKTL